MDADPFDELRRGLRGEGGDATDDRREGSSRSAHHLLGMAAGAVLLAVGVVIVSAARTPPTPEAPSPTPTIDVLDDKSASAPTTISPATRVWPAEPVEVVGNEVRTGGHRWQVGEPGDLVAVGDWDCDGTPTPAVLRPATGALHLFDSWAAADAPVVASAGPTVPPGATALDAGACGQARIRTADDRTLDVNTDGSRR